MAETTTEPPVAGRGRPPSTPTRARRGTRPGQTVVPLLFIAAAVVLFSYKSHQLGRALAEGLGLPAVLRHHNLEGPYHRSLAAAARAPKRFVVAERMLGMFAAKGDAKPVTKGA